MRGLVFGAVAFAVLAVNAFEVVERDGRFTVKDGARVIISDLSVERGGAGAKPKFVRTGKSAPRVWNEWDESADGRYRLEVVEHADGTVEITMLGQVFPFDKLRGRRLNFTVPREVLAGREFRALAGDGREWRERKGVVDAAFGRTRETREQYRWFCADGIVFDFNPLGAADYTSGYTQNGIKGTWAVVPKKDGDFLLMGGSDLTRAWGGFMGCKFVLRKGSFADYGKYHFVEKYRYASPMPVCRLVALGAAAFGKAYADGNFAWTDEKGFGWESPVSGNAVVRGHKEGVYYAAVKGRGKGVYRFSGLEDGYYLLTVDAGNYKGVANRFSVRFDGGDATSDGGIVRDVTVAKRTARQFTRAVHIKGGTGRVVLEGDWLVSAIGLQPLLGDGEDYSVTRGFWFTDGYEPCVIYRNSDTSAPMTFAVGDDTYDLPEPGTETAGTPRDPPTPVELPDPDQPSLDWMKNASIGRTAAGDVTLAEFDDPETLVKYFDQEFDGRGYNAIMGTGLHSRHTFPGSIDRSVDAIRRHAAEAHRRGMKFIDHHDGTVLWNTQVGLRVLMQRADELLRSRVDGRPSWHFCPCNEKLCETWYGYLRRLVAEAKVDALQLDEVEFWAHGCACAACRKRFREEVGWSIPMNECDPSLADEYSPLRRRWDDWRIKTITNWFVELRRRLKDVKPDLVLTMYTTHYGLTASMPHRGGSSDLIDLGRAINFFGTEVMTRNVSACLRCLPAYRKVAHALHNAYGTPIWAWYYGSNATVDYLAMCLANMNGESALLGDNPPGPGEPRGAEFLASPLNMRREGAKTVAEVALLYSGQSRDWNRLSDQVYEIIGIAQELERLHIPYDVLLDRSIEAKTLAKYKVLFVGSANCVTDGEVAEIKAFAKRGGKVWLSALAGTCDRIGNPRETWAFADVFPGVTPAVRKPVIVRDAGNFRYTSLQDSQKCVTREAYVGAVAGPAPDPAVEAKVAAELREFCRGAEVWTVDAPDKVYTTLWREADGTLVVHFLNGTGCDLKPGEKVTAAAPKNPFPALEKDVAFTVRGGTAATAYSPDFTFGGRELVVRRNADGTLTVTLPKEFMKAYTLVRIK